MKKLKAFQNIWIFVKKVFSIGQKKLQSERTELFFITASNFNKTSMV